MPEGDTVAFAATGIVAVLITVPCVMVTLLPELDRTGLGTFNVKLFAEFVTVAIPPVTDPFTLEDTEAVVTTVPCVSVILFPELDKAGLGTFTVKLDPLAVTLETPVPVPVKAEVDELTVKLG